MTSTPANGHDSVTDGRLSRSARKVAIPVLAVFSLVGVYALYSALGWPVLVIGGTVVLAAVGMVCFISAENRTVYWRIIFWLGAALVSPLVLFGFNVLWNWRPLPHLPLGVGLVVAVAVFATVGFFYLWLGASRRVAASVGFTFALVFVLGLPILISKFEDRQEVAPPELLVSQLDVLLVVAGGPTSDLPSIEPDPAAASWDIRYSVARMTGHSLRWVLLNSPSPDAARRAAAGDIGFVAGEPTLREHADHALMLVVDGTPPVVVDPTALPNVAGTSGEVGRWRRVARLAAPPGTPTFALLQTTDERRVGRWDEWLGERSGAAVSVQRSGAQAITDTALHVATSAPTAQEDMALALKYRPLLLFDTSDPVDTPLEVDTFFRSGLVELCREEVRETSCEKVHGSSQLENGATHLRIDVPEPGAPARREVAARTNPAPGRVVGPLGPAPGTASAIYVHVVPGDGADDNLVYLDYWWYLSYNQARSAAGASCGAGLVIPGKTCFDHQSDWEGVTVVVDRTGKEPVPVAVQYAQHSDVVSYPWDYLRRIWQGEAYRPLVRGVDDASDRPLVFVARGTHASYPKLCPPNCRQVAHKNREEKVHRGDEPWPGNDTTRCTADVCLKALPTHNRGADPALWNAFEGTWGERHCILVYYCDSDNAPTAPASQDRYKEPWEIDGTVDATGRFSASEG
jgi:hypothetical protein